MKEKKLKKIIFTFLVGIATLFITFCVNKTNLNDNIQIEDIEKEDVSDIIKISSSDSIYKVTDVQGAFYGTEKERKERLTPNPDKFKVDKLATVFVKFVIEKDSAVKTAEIIRGYTNEMNDEAIKLIKSVKWTPGIEHNEIVRSEFVYGVAFSPK